MTLLLTEGKRNPRRGLLKRWLVGGKVPLDIQYDFLTRTYRYNPLDDLGLRRYNILTSMLSKHYPGVYYSVIMLQKEIREYVPKP